MAPYYQYPANHFGSNDFNPILMSNTSHSVHPSNYVDTDYQYWHQQNELWAHQIQNQSEVQDSRMGENHYMNQDWSRPGYIQNQQEVQDSRMVQNHPVYHGWAPQLHIQNHPVNQGWAPQGQTQPEVQDPRMVQNHPMNQVWAPPGHIQNQPEFQNHPVNQVWDPQERIRNQPEVHDRQLVPNQHQEAHQREGNKRQIQKKQQKVKNDSKKVAEGYKFYCELCRKWLKTDVHFKRGKCKNCE